MLGCRHHQSRCLVLDFEADRQGLAARDSVAVRQESAALACR